MLGKFSRTWHGTHELREWHGASGSIGAQQLHVARGPYGLQNGWQARRPPPRGCWVCRACEQLTKRGETRVQTAVLHSEGRAARRGGGVQLGAEELIELGQAFEQLRLVWRPTLTLLATRTHVAHNAVVAQCLERVIKRSLAPLRLPFGDKGGRALREGEASWEQAAA